MDGHLVTVEVSVEAFANQWVQVDGVAFDQGGFEGLNSHPVQGWSTVQQHWVIGDHLFENVPDFLVLALEHLFG